MTLPLRQYFTFNRMNLEKPYFDAMNWLKILNYIGIKLNYFLFKISDDTDLKLLILVLLIVMATTLYTRRLGIKND